MFYDFICFIRFCLFFKKANLILKRDKRILVEIVLNSKIILPQCRVELGKHTCEKKPLRDSQK